MHAQAASEHGNAQGVSHLLPHRLHRLDREAEGCSLRHPDTHGEDSQHVPPFINQVKDTEPHRHVHRTPSILHQVHGRVGGGVPFQDA